jgi:hypothetical protein
MGMGVENVMGVKPSDDMPHAEAMMKDLLAIVAPPGAPAASPLPSPGPKSASRGLLSLLEGNAWAQQLPVATKTTKTRTAGVKVSKAVPRVKVKQAPFLLARVISFNVGGRNFVPQSALMAAIPEFQAVPVEQFQFKLEKMSVGPAYRDAVDAKVQELAAKPQRDMVDWFVLSHGLNELRLLNQLVDFSKVAPQPLAPAGGGTSTAPGALPTSGGITAAPSAAGGTTERPFAPSGAEARPNATELRPGLPGAAAPSEAGAPTRPDQPSALAPAASPPKTELPSGAPKTEAPSAVPKSAPPSGTQPGPAAP